MGEYNAESETYDQPTSITDLPAFLEKAAARLQTEQNEFATSENEETTEGETAAFSMPYAFNLYDTVIFQTPKYISLITNTDMYAGGAHPNYNISYQTFEVETGKLFSLADVVSDTTAFLTIAEKYFNEQLPMESTETEGKVTYDDLGLWFPEGKFYVPENFLITDQKFDFLYQTYEIGPYAIGALPISIPIKEVEKLLKIKIW